MYRIILVNSISARRLFYRNKIQQEADDGPTDQKHEKDLPPPSSRIAPPASSFPFVVISSSAHHLEVNLARTNTVPAATVSPGLIGCCRFLAFYRRSNALAPPLLSCRAKSPSDSQACEHCRQANESVLANVAQSRIRKSVVLGA
jgi:hypothetical protein